MVINPRWPKASRGFFISMAMDSGAVRFNQFGALAFSIIIGAAIIFSYPGLAWHDQQRIYQTALVIFSVLGLFLIRGAHPHFLLSPIVFWVGFLLFAFALASTALSNDPFWAAVEFALVVGNIGIAIFVFLLIRRFGLAIENLLSDAIRWLLVIVVVRFYSMWAAALLQPELFFTPWNLLDGFSNMRFQGQFFTIVVPLLLVPSFSATLLFPDLKRSFNFFLMASLAAMVFVAGTRGTVAAWSVSVLVLLFLGNVPRRLGLKFFLVMVAGAALAQGILYSISIVNGWDMSFRFSSEQVLGLSARDQLWEAAWQQILLHPWFGVGPMHFAALGHPIAAHPHQSLLQIAGEWGVPVLVMVGVLFLIWLKRTSVGFSNQRDSEKNPLYFVFMLSIISSLVQSLVDGVLVMPYPQIWLAIVFGWCSAHYMPIRVERTIEVPMWVPKLIFTLAALMLSFVALRDFSLLMGAGDFCGKGVRYWCNGRI